MVKQLLNIGVSKTNDDNLNRKIRISNLISILTIVTMFGYIPVAIYFNVFGIIILAKGKKFKYKALNDLLLANVGQSMAFQKEHLNNTVEQWRGNLEQVDDILVIGIKL